MENVSPSADRSNSSKAPMIRFSNSFSQSISELLTTKEKIGFVSLADLSGKGFSRSVQEKTIH